MSMSFRKRNVGIADGKRIQPITGVTPTPTYLPGVRPSAIDGRSVTSTGSVSFDGLFAGHGGIPLGTSMIIEESGTTDYAGALVRFYAAEGLMQGHHVHLVALPEQWGRDLPGLGVESKKTPREVPQEERMKIAWRYEKLGQHEADPSGRDRSVPGRNPAQSEDGVSPKPFCHTFDLSKRLVHPPSAQISYLPVVSDPAQDCFGQTLSKLRTALASAKQETVHRLVIPSLMSPALYPQRACLPEQILRFQHDLRKLLVAYPKKLVILQTLPLALYPRSTGLTKWIELLADGVYDLTPFPHSADAEFLSSRDPDTKDELPQGLLRIHKLPILHESGVGTVPADTDWTFSLSRRKFTIKPYNLPPVEGDTDAQQEPVKEKPSNTKNSGVDF